MSSHLSLLSFSSFFFLKYSTSFFLKTVYLNYLIY